MKMRGLLMLGAAAVALSVSSPAAADAVTDWWDVANKLNFAQQVSPTPSPAEMQRASARAALAMFEAVNAIDRRYESYLGFPAGDPKASQDAAAATAAHEVLVKHYTANKPVLDESYTMAMAGIPDGPAKDAGAAIGKQAAAAANGANGADPAIPQVPYRPMTTPGEWIGASLPTLEPYWATFKPWLSSPDTIMAPPPPSLTSETWARDYEEVRRLGARASKERTEEQTLIARYRQGYDLSPMVRYIADRPGRRQVENARLLALYEMAMNDAVQAMVVAKLKYNYWRPITAIRNGDRDGNDATQHDPAWIALLPTPNFPEYPCGHCTAVAVQTEVLKLAGGLPANTPVRIASGISPNLVVQQVKSWDEAVRQVSDSRMLGGVHYRFSNDAGEDIGRKAARMTVEKALRPLPNSKRSR
jgi:hypothetical protein